MAPTCGTDTPVRRCADWKAWAVIWKLRPAPRKPNSLASSASSLPYLDNNQHFIVNYGDRYRHGEPIASGFVESAVNPASGSSNGSRWLGDLSTRTTCCKSGLPCSITSSGLTLNDGIRPFPEERTTAVPRS